MAGLGLRFLIDGERVDDPQNWDEVEIQAIFDTDPDGLRINEGAVQPTIVSEQFLWVGSGATKIINYVRNGDSGGRGIFEALPLQISSSSGGESLEIFDGYLDFMNVNILSPVEVMCSIKKKASLDTFATRIKANSVGYLESKGVFLQNDYVSIPYVVERTVTADELIQLSIALFIMIKELTEAIARTVQRITDLIKAVNPDVTVPFAVANVGAIISAILLIAIEIIYQILMAIAIVALMKQLIELIISPVRRHKGIKLRTLLEKSANFLGYGFFSPISELDTYVYLPSSPKKDQPLLTGLPKPQDFGYNLSEAYELVLQIFNAKIAIIDNVIQLRTRSDTFWTKTAEYELPDTNRESENFNTDAMKANRLIKFATDPQDKWTLDNFEGTAFEVIVEPIDVKDQKLVLLEGLDSINIPVALGTRKGSLTPVEFLVRGIAGFVDGLLGVFGNSPGLVKSINQRVGMLKVSDQIHTVPKLLALNSAGSLLKNHREVLDAEYIYDNFHSQRSLVANNFKEQMQVFRGETVPNFGQTDFAKTTKNSFFVGGGKFNNLRWKLSADTALADFEEPKIYSRNLREIRVKPK